MAKRDYRKGDLAALGGFVPLPHVVLDSSAYATLSASAVKLLMDVCRQYTGRNNGRLTPSYGLLKDRGWKSVGTLDRAKKELRDSRLVTVTKQGGRRKGDCELWAINWLKLDWRHDMDIQPGGHDYMGFLKLEEAKVKAKPLPKPHLVAVA